MELLPVGVQNATHPGAPGATERSDGLPGAREAEREGAIARRGKQPKRKAARLRGRAKPKDQRAQERGAVGGPENPTRPGEQLAEPPPTFPGRRREKG